MPVVIAPRILCALLAAGLGQRLGGNKMEAMLNGKMLATYAAGSLGNANIGDLVAVTRGDTHALRKWLTNSGYTVLANDAPSRGLSSSIALAASHAQAGKYDALMIVLGDMPYVPVDHLRRLALGFVQRRMVSAHNGAKMPPAIFPASDFAELITLTGESGARRLLDQADFIQANMGDLVDIDTPADLKFANTKAN